MTSHERYRHLLHDLRQKPPFTLHCAYHSVGAFSTDGERCQLHWAEMKRVGIHRLYRKLKRCAGYAANQRWDFSSSITLYNINITDPSNAHISKLSRELNSSNFCFIIHRRSISIKSSKSKPQCPERSDGAGLRSLPRVLSSTDTTHPAACRARCRPRPRAQALRLPSSPPAAAAALWPPRTAPGSR